MKDIKHILHHDYKFSLIMVALISFITFVILLGIFYESVNDFMLKLKIPLFLVLLLQIILGGVTYWLLFELLHVFTCTKTIEHFKEVHESEKKENEFNKFLKVEIMKKIDFLQMFTPWFSMEFGREPFKFDASDKFEELFSEILEEFGAHNKLEIPLKITSFPNDKGHILAHIVIFKNSAIVLRARHNGTVVYVEAFWIGTQTLEDVNKKIFIDSLNKKILAKLSSFGLGLNQTQNPSWANVSRSLNETPELGRLYPNIIDKIHK